MTINDAKNLIAGAVLQTGEYQQWADLGCGTGTFSYALAGLLPKKSNITCVDKEPQDIKHIQNTTILQFQRADIEQVHFQAGALDGILMANSLHYVRDQQPYIQRLYTFLNITGSFIIVEYDTDKGNQWVPYPLSFNSLKKLFQSYGAVKKLNERPSLYGRANLYACQVTK